MTNSSGASIATDTYDAYGKPGSGNIGRFQYTGQTFVAEAGLYYYKARFYNPDLGRFMQTDPIGYQDGMNLYAYVGGDPINATDSSGLASSFCGITGCSSVYYDPSFGDHSTGLGYSGGGNGGGGFIPVDEICYSCTGTPAPFQIGAGSGSSSYMSGPAQFGLGVLQGLAQLGYDLLIADGSGPYPTGLGVLFGAEPGPIFGAPANYWEASGRVVGSLGTLAAGGAASFRLGATGSTSISVLRYSAAGETFFRYETSAVAFSRVTASGGVRPGTFAAPISDGLISVQNRVSVYALPDPQFPRSITHVLSPPTGTLIIGPRPVRGGTGYEVLFPNGF